jgi:hypothetical protein
MFHNSLVVELTNMSPTNTEEVNVHVSYVSSSS